METNKIMNVAVADGNKEVKLIVPYLSTIKGTQWTEFTDALMDAYNRESLSEMVRVKLERNLDEIAGGSTYSAVAFNLVDWAKRSGYLTELLQGALDMPPRKVTKKGSTSVNFPKRKLQEFARSVGAQEA